ncbi:hypothetical protein [Streptomyces sp. S1D4-14]|uniref:hypothetical protein n=1 Tax=Streptomyces sp. S1D4-14 TaxID=2594461 RepID=UPI001164226A|nr:hypothetical protein [Streptomyces sp. S1D4-14]QDN64322.1 hypothetical protein FNV66_00435 [Streptomyces sp. S1D4-14]
MVEPIPPELSPAQRARLKQLTNAVRLRAALYPPPKRRRWTRQYPGGRPNPWRSARLRRRLQR